MSLTDALWSSTLHYCVLESEMPERLVEFYADEITICHGNRCSWVRCRISI